MLDFSFVRESQVVTYLVKVPRAWQWKEKILIILLQVRYRYPPNYAWLICLVMCYLKCRGGKMLANWWELSPLSFLTPLCIAVGNPKGVTLSHHNLINNGYHIGHRIGYDIKASAVSSHTLIILCRISYPRYHLGSAVYCSVKNKYYLNYFQIGETN